VLVHLGSWGNDPGRPSRETKGGLDIRDISFYRGRSLDEILDIEQPDAAFLLSTQTYAHRAFLRYCKVRSIPTLHAYHGVVNVQATNDENDGHETNRLAHARYVLARLPKLLRRTFPCYVTALLKTNAGFKDWRRFLVDTWHLATGKKPSVASEDARTSKCAVYTAADVEHAVRTYGFSEIDVVAVGNPDLAQFGLTEDRVGTRITKAHLETGDIMYIDTGLPALALHFRSWDAFAQHLCETARSLKLQGRRLLLKPHPACDLGYLRERLEGAQIEIITNADLLERLEQCSACIVESTTLALLPALLGMPLLLAKYGNLRGLGYGPILTSYPRAYTLEDVERVNEILRADREALDEAAVDRWISLNSGPLPAEELPRRIAEIFESMVVAQNDWAANLES
jgi:hypothetical protein